MNRRDSRVALHCEAPLVTIVDDDEAVCEALESLLKSVGFRADVFASAEGFINSDHLDETKCLILDVRMPGMSGLELQEQLAAAYNHIPIIFITAHADDDARARAMQSGAVAFLSKPFVESALLDAVRATTGTSAGGDEPPA
ncbi:MAG TPA: response regulator [Blastocatellia bacterium]|nr:response regulator [Blastocatellia bacterium]